MEIKSCFNTEVLSISGFLNCNTENSESIMQTFTFYSKYTDIQGLYECKFMKQFDKVLNYDFSPPYLEVIIPSDMRRKLILNPESVYAPSTRIGIPCKGTTFEDEEVRTILNEYDALSFSFNDVLIKY